MPLPPSPVDGAPMRKIHRYGIEFEVCPTTGGVWLDKGKLEKLIALVQAEAILASHSDRGPDRYRNDEDHAETHRHDRLPAQNRSRLADLYDF
jgi:uncharacterized protein